MFTKSIVVGALLITFAACGSDTSGPVLANVQLEIVWPRLEDDGFIGTTYWVKRVHYEVVGRNFEDGWLESEHETVAEGQIPASTSSWTVRIKNRCDQGYWISVQGYYEARGPDAICYGFITGFDLACEGLQTAIIEPAYEYDPLFESDGCLPPGG